MMEKPVDIASHFNINGEIVSVTPLTGGLINTTYMVRTSPGEEDYILQRKNKNIFTDIPAMMDNIVKVTGHIKAKVIEAGGDPLRETMTIVMTVNGLPYYTDDAGEYWTMTVFIPDTVTHDVARTPQLAFKGGEGIGRFQRQLADFTGKLGDVLPGFHDLGYRLEQWGKAVINDKAGRVKELSREISWIESRKDKMLGFWQLVETGALPKRVTHNDTKLSNILFDNADNVLCVIDLDTVMSNTVLADYGDAIRSFANTAAEDEPDMEKVSLDKTLFEAYTRGYLKETADMLNDTEQEWLAFGPLYITFEQTLRFLMDYIDGDIYYKTGYPSHNLVRARSQNKLLESMEENYGYMEKTVEEILRTLRNK